MSWTPTIDTAREVALLASAGNPAARNPADAAHQQVTALRAPSAGDFSGTTATAATTLMADLTGEVNRIHTQSAKIRDLYADITAVHRDYNAHYQQLSAQLVTATAAVGNVDPYKPDAAATARADVARITADITAARTAFTAYLAKFMTVNGDVPITSPNKSQTRAQLGPHGVRLVNTENGTVSVMHGKDGSAQLSGRDGKVLVTVGKDGTVTGADGKPLPMTPEARKILSSTIGQVGERYAWGGGHGPNSGPSFGIDDPSDPDSQKYGDRNLNGVDCSGLVRMGVTGVGQDIGDGNTNMQLTSPLLTTPQAQVWTGTAGDPARVGAQPGDLLYYGTSTTDTHHVAFYLGNGVILEAPQSGSDVTLNLSTAHGDLVAVRRVK